MFSHTKLVLIYFSIASTDLTCAQVTKPSPIVLKLDTDQILQSIRNALDHQLVRNIAQEIASKAAKSFVDEINKTTNVEVTLESGSDAKKVDEDSEKKRKKEVKHEDDKKQEDKIKNVEIIKHDNVEDIQEKKNDEIKPDGEVKHEDETKHDDKGKKVEEFNDDKKLRGNNNPAPAKKEKEELKILDEQAAYTLLRDPSPDGDNLGLDSLENPVPVNVRPQKINGIYMRTLSGNKQPIYVVRKMNAKYFADELRGES